jgi:cyclophilin family peptidyl-prolyl cis-trans isomerase
MNRLLAACLVLIFASTTFAQAPSSQPSAPAAKKSWDKAPDMQIDANKSYTATIETTKGKIVLKLFPKEAPKTVNNFVFLARQGFYNGTIFHRVIPGFMIQGGDPMGVGVGGPGYKFENENKNSAHGFTPGTLAMANAGPDTNGSQFFIMDGTAGLPAAGYTIFGELTQGQDIVRAIATSPRNEQDRPNTTITMTSVTIEEK